MTWMDRGIAFVQMMAGVLCLAAIVAGVGIVGLCAWDAYARRMARDRDPWPP